VLVGADDTATPQDRSHDITTRIPGARQIVIPDAGHLSAWEQPDAVYAAIAPFLESLPHRP
jgi:pimeloyl-ACP methyl ester carboxylesterase